jgi:RNA polymerase sigma-70 factor, ECF subfamily
MPLPAATSGLNASRAESREASEHRWLEAVRRGDQAVFTEAFDALFPAVRAFLYRYTESTAIAEELAQDVFVKWWDERERLDIHTSLRTYLFAAARNKAFNHRRHEGVANRWVAAEALDGIPACDDTDWAARESEIAEAVAQAVRTLSPRTRQVFILYRLKSLTYADIAARLGITVKTVDNHVARAVRALRERLAIHRP